MELPMFIITTLLISLYDNFVENLLFDFFGHIKSDFVRYLIWICLKSQLG